jgi:hypothetical protein
MFMLFLVRWKMKPEMRDAVYKRMKEKSHNAPPTLKFVGSWIALHQLDGWAVVETDDPMAVGKWLYAWSDTCEHEITPVTDYESIRSFLG